MDREGKSTRKPCQLVPLYVWPSKSEARRRTLLVGGVVQLIVGELAFAVNKYRRWSWTRLNVHLVVAVGVCGIVMPFTRLALEARRAEAACDADIYARAINVAFLSAQAEGRDRGRFMLRPFAWPSPAIFGHSPNSMSLAEKIKFYATHFEMTSASAQLYADRLRPYAECGVLSKHDYETSVIFLARGADHALLTYGFSASWISALAIEWVSKRTIIPGPRLLRVLPWIGRNIPWCFLFPVFCAYHAVMYQQNTTYFQFQDRRAVALSMLRAAGDI